MKYDIENKYFHKQNTELILDTDIPSTTWMIKTFQSFLSQFCR